MDNNICNSLEKFNLKLELLGITEYYYDTDNKLVILDKNNITRLILHNSTTQDNFNDINFSELPKLSYIKMPNSIKKISARTFDKCRRLDSVKFSSSLEIIEEYAFAGCNRLQEIDLSNCEKLKYIGYEAFSTCSNLRIIHFPKSISNIGRRVFKDDNSITTVHIHKFGNITYKQLDYAGIDIRKPDIKIVNTY